MHKYTITSYLKKNIWLHPHFITV